MRSESEERGTTHGLVAIVVVVVVVDVAVTVAALASLRC